MKNFGSRAKIFIYLIIVILLILTFFNYISLWFNNAIFTTVFAGTAIFVIGQLLSRFILDPIQKQKEIIGKIIFAPSFYGNKFPFEDENGKIVNIDELNQSSIDIRTLASELRASTKNIPFYNFFSLIKIIPNVNNIKEASSSLIGWSNSFYTKNEIPNPRIQFRKEISKALNIELE